MHAGRYLLINIVAFGLFLFFSVYAVYVGWLAFRISGCAELVGGCGALEGKLNQTVRPMGLLAAGILVLSATVMRIHYLRLSPLWGLAMFVWFGAATDFFLSAGNLWLSGIGLAAVLRQLPIEAIFLVVLCGFLCLPIELYALPTGFLGRLFVAVTGFTASWSFAFTVINSAKLPLLARSLSGQDWLANGLAAMQGHLHGYAIFGRDGLTPMLVALAVFVATLTMIVMTGRKVVFRRSLRHTVEFN